MSHERTERVGFLQDRVAIVTGAGRGLGRAHANLLARLGAKVLINDSGTGADGRGSDAGPAQAVVEEIHAFGGDAVANTADVSDWAGAQSVIDDAVEAFGDLHVLVNNAGVLRHGPLVDMPPEDWADVLAINLGGTFAMTQSAARYWRDRCGTDRMTKASIINTSSVSGLQGIRGQSNYGPAKAGILVLTLVAAAELASFGVRVNAVCPIARTRLTWASPTPSDEVKADPAGAWDPYDPTHVSPLVAALAAADCNLSGQIYSVIGSAIGLWQGWREVASVDNGPQQWDVQELSESLHRLPSDLNQLFR